MHYIEMHFQRQMTRELIMLKSGHKGIDLCSTVIFEVIARCSVNVRSAWEISSGTALFLRAINDFKEFRPNDGIYFFFLTFQRIRSVRLSLVFLCKPFS